MMRGSVTCLKRIDLMMMINPKTLNDLHPITKVVDGIPRLQVGEGDGRCFW